MLKHGHYHQSHHIPDGTGNESIWKLTEQLKGLVKTKTGRETLTMAEILLEEVAEAMAEPDRFKLREELIQVATVALAWVARIDNRKQNGLPEISRG